MVDVIFHTSVVERAKRESQYKLFLIQVVLEKVEDKFELELSRGGPLPPFPLSVECDVDNARSGDVSRLRDSQDAL